MVNEFFDREKIEFFAFLPFEVCEFTDRARMERFLDGKAPRCVCVFLIPYFVNGQGGNLSRYAHARDYHLYFDALIERAKDAFPQFLLGLADRSPICERTLALKAGLGLRGENGLLLNPKYGSFCFIGVFLFSDLPQGARMRRAQPIRRCSRCGACLPACPTDCLRDPGAPCLSALTQAKRLTDAEEKLVADAKLIWGCDCCQEACPVNRNASQTPIAFFREHLIADLTEERLKDMIRDGEWPRRAYAWRGKDVLFRNLTLQKRK